MEAELQALRQRNEELMRAVQEQQSIAATKRVRADQRSRAQTQEFANLAAELIAGRQGLEVQYEGMRFSVKVEKPETYDGDKAKDLDTWLFQVLEHLELSTVPVRETRRIRCVFVTRQCSSVVEGSMRSKLSARHVGGLL